MNRKSVFLLPIVAFVTVLFLTLNNGPASAGGGQVTNCSDDTDFSNRLAGGGLITFNCGTASILLSSTKTITTDTTINGGGSIALSGGGARRLFYVNPSVSLTLTNIIIRDGNYPSFDGGAIYNDHGTVNIINSKLFSNTVGSGCSGGAIASFGVLNIRGSEFAYNSAGNGGALFPRESTSFTTISGSNFHDNYTTNTTNGWGGAMLVWNGAHMSIDSSAFVANHAQHGGALYLTSVSVLTLTSSSMAGNKALYNGGGIFNVGTLTLNNSALSGNNAPGGFGGGINNDSSSTATLNNSSLSGNLAADGGGIENRGALTLNTSTI